MKTLAVIALTLAPCLAWGAPGIDLAANNRCPGVAGALSDGGILDCAALAAAGDHVRLYATFLTAEDIPDLVALEGRINVEIVGDLSSNGSFWNGAPGSCLIQNGGAVQLLGTKPTNGDPCGSSLSIREVFGDGAESVAVLDGNSPSHMDYYFSVCRGSAFSARTPSRIFGFEMRFDPAYSTEAGGPCGTCVVPVCFELVYAHPVSLSGLPTTTLTTSSGIPGVDTRAMFNAGCPVTASRIAAATQGAQAAPPPYGCAPVPTRSPTWGRLKSLYR
jgi:hypothetical protein